MAPASKAGEAQALEGSTPSPSAAVDAPLFGDRLTVGFQALTLAMLVRVQLPDLADGGSVGNPVDHSPSEGEMLWVRVPPEPLTDAPVVKRRSHHSAKVEVLVQLQAGVLQQMSSGCAGTHATLRRS